MAANRHHRIETCAQCSEDYCRNCTNADDVNMFCSTDCEEDYYADSLEFDPNDEPDGSGNDEDEEL